MCGLTFKTITKITHKKNCICKIGIKIAIVCDPYGSGPMVQHAYDSRTNC